MKKSEYDDDDDDDKKTDFAPPRPPKGPSLYLWIYNKFL